jgi:hypothetical protein
MNSATLSQPVRIAVLAVCGVVAYLVYDCSRPVREGEWVRVGVVSALTARLERRFPNELSIRVRVPLQDSMFRAGRLRAIYVSRCSEAGCGAEGRVWAVRGRGARPISLPGPDGTRNDTGEVAIEYGVSPANGVLEVPPQELRTGECYAVFVHIDQRSAKAVFEVSDSSVRYSHVDAVPASLTGCWEALTAAPKSSGWDSTSRP